MDLLGEVAYMLSQDVDRLLGQIRDGVARKDCKAVESAAHQLKGALSNFGPSAAVDAALGVEEAGRTEDLTDARQLCDSLRQEADRLTAFLLDLPKERAA